MADAIELGLNTFGDVTLRADSAEHASNPPEHALLHQAEVLRNVVAEAMLALVVMDHALRHRAQCGDVNPPVSPIG